MRRKQPVSTNCLVARSMLDVVPPEGAASEAAYGIRDAEPRRTEAAPDEAPTADSRAAPRSAGGLDAANAQAVGAACGGGAGGEGGAPPSVRRDHELAPARAGEAAFVDGLGEALNRVAGFTLRNIQHELESAAAKRKQRILSVLDGVGQLFIAISSSTPNSPHVASRQDDDPYAYHAALQRAGGGALPIGVRVHIQFVQDADLLPVLEATFRLGGLAALRDVLPHDGRNTWATW